MATRCNIQINDPNTEIWLYRHWDGYPEVTGEDMKDYLRYMMPETASQLAEAIVNNDSEHYRYTKSQHGDIEYLYQIYIGDFDVIMQTIHLPLVMKFDGEVVRDRKTIKTETFKR